MTVQQIYEAMKSPPIRTVTKTDLLLMLNQVVIEDAFNMRRQTPSLEEVEEIVRTLYKELKTTYAELRVDEIRLAIRAGIFDQLEKPMFGLVPAEFVKAIQTYSVDKRRKDALEMMPNKAQTAAIPSKEEIERMNEKATRQSFKCYEADVREKGHINSLCTTVPAAVFDWLFDQGQITLSQIELKELEKAQDPHLKKKVLLEKFFQEKHEHEKEDPTFGRVQGVQM